MFRSSISAPLLAEVDNIGVLRGDAANDDNSSRLFVELPNNVDNSDDDAMNDVVIEDGKDHIDGDD